MEREKVIDSLNTIGAEEACSGLWYASTENIMQLARLVEQETLEMAISVLDTADKKNPYEKWSPGAPSAIIKKLKDDHDKE